MRPRLALVPGEPAGVGPELVVRAAQRDWDAELTVFGDAAILRRAATVLDLPLALHAAGSPPAQPRSLALVDIPHPADVTFGNPALATIARTRAASHRTSTSAPTAATRCFHPRNSLVERRTAGLKGWNSTFHPIAYPNRPHGWGTTAHASG